jgi:hypothetical protein
MKLIPSYQEFVDNMSLTEKISPELAESLAADLEEIESLNEGVLDSIKNTLSKTFLGSLSSINMIDKSREMILKDRKDLLSKKYSHEDEIESLNASLKKAQDDKDTANADKISKTIANKENEYKTYVNMINKRIEKTEDVAEKIIEGNKRKSEYYDAGVSQDELTIAEFEYKLAKSRSNVDPKEIKELETKIQTAKVESEKAQAELKASEEKKAKEAEDKKEKVKSELSSQVDEIDSKIEELEKKIEELQVKRIQNKNKRLSPVDQDSLESNKASLKKMKDRKKDIEKALRGSGSRKNQKLDKYVDFTKNQKNAKPVLTASKGGKADKEEAGASAASKPRGRRKRSNS